MNGNSAANLSKLAHLLDTESLRILVEFNELGAKSLVAEELRITPKRVSEVLRKVQDAVKTVCGTGIFHEPVSTRSLFNSQGKELASLAREHLDNFELMLTAFTSGSSVTLRSASNGLSWASELDKALEERANTRAPDSRIVLNMDYPRTASIRPETMGKGVFAIFSMLLDPSEVGSEFSPRATPRSHWTLGSTEMITLASEELRVLTRDKLPSIEGGVASLLREGVNFLVTEEGSVPDRYLSPPRVHPWYRRSHLQRIPHLDCGLRVLKYGLGTSSIRRLAMIVHGPRDMIEEKARRAGLEKPHFMPLSKPGEMHPRAITVFAWNPSSSYPTESEKAVWAKALHLWHEPREKAVLSL